jgi:hypothetical protein
MITLQELEQLKEEKLNSLQEGIVGTFVKNAGAGFKRAARVVAPVAVVYTGVLGIDRVIRGLLREADKKYRECSNNALNKFNKKMVGLKGFPYYKLKHLEAQYTIDLEECKHAHKLRILKIKEKKAAMKAEMAQRKKQIKK